MEIGLENLYVDVGGILLFQVPLPLHKMLLQSFEEGLAIIIFLAIFAGIPLKLEKVRPTLPCPSLPCLATDGRQQFQCLLVVLFLEFNIDAKTSFLRRQQIARHNYFKIQYEIAKLDRYFWNSMAAKHTMLHSPFNQGNNTRNHLRHHGRPFGGLIGSSDLQPVFALRVSVVLLLGLTIDVFSMSGQTLPRYFRLLSGKSQRKSVNAAVACVQPPLPAEIMGEGSSCSVQSKAILEMCLSQLLDGSKSRTPAF